MHTPMFVLLQLRVGQVRLRQLGREVCLSAGECVLIDGKEPYDLQCPDLTKAVALRLPADWLRRWIAEPERHAARLFNTGGWSSALCAAVACLDVNSCDQQALPRDAFADPIATLLTLAIGAEREAASPPTLFNQLLRTLQNRFHEADLSPLTVAVEHGVSTRSVHYAFARAHTTFVERLMDLRLARAQEMLGNVQLFELPVAEVAARCGFSDPSHFARRFRRHFGQSPLQFRSSAARVKH